MLWIGLQCVSVVFPDHTHFFKSYVQPKLFAKVISSASFVEAAIIPHMVINDPAHAPKHLKMLILKFCKSQYLENKGLIVQSIFSMFSRQKPVHHLTLTT